MYPVPLPLPEKQDRKQLLALAESYNVRTSLSRAILRDGHTGLSPVARSTLSSK
jgi:hypothetical protein